MSGDVKPEIRREAVQRARKELGDRADKTRLTMRMVKHVRMLALQHAEEAIKVFVNIIQSDNTTRAEKMAAASAILDRGLGKPVSHHHMNVDTSGESVLDADAIQNLPDDEIQRAIQTIQDLIERATGGTLIDVTPESDSETGS